MTSIVDSSSTIDSFSASFSPTTPVLAGDDDDGCGVTGSFPCFCSCCCCGERCEKIVVSSSFLSFLSFLSMLSCCCCGCCCCGDGDGGT